VFGLLGGLAWARREVLESVAEGAMEKMGEKRDALWLKQHPINYA
jgi:hypothetical protein